MDNQDKIDLVYTWVDGSDEKHFAKRLALIEKMHLNIPKNFNNQQYVEHNELKYSLRSVEKFANWINNIYIITDAQIPKWLNVDNPRIKIIDHKDIMPKNALPNFNSNAIECCIKNIPDLSEKFIYSNDDCFFLSTTDPAMFFNEKKVKNYVNKHRYIIIYKKGKHIQNIYTNYCKNSIQLLNRHFGNINKFNYKLMHCATAYLKNDALECYNLFKKEIDATINCNFRETQNINFAQLFTGFSVGKGNGEYILENTDENILIRFFRYLFKKKVQTNCFYGKMKHIRKTIRKIKKSNAKLACINDDSNLKERHYQIYNAYMQSLFPDKSEFEK